MICKNTMNTEGIKNYQVYLDRGSRVISTQKSSDIFGEGDEMLNVLVYGDEYHLDSDDSEVRKFAFALAENPYLRIRMITEPKSEYARDADVIVAGFDKRNKRFYDKLREYNDGTRLILTGRIGKKNLSDFLKKVDEKTKELEVQ